MDNQEETAGAADHFNRLDGYFSMMAPSDYVGCDGADPEYGPWASWCADEVDAIPSQFALFAWWYFCDAFDCFMSPRGGKYPGYVLQNGPESDEVKRIVDQDLVSHLQVLKTLRNRPLDLETRYEESDFFPDEDHSTWDPIKLGAAYVVWCIDQGLLGLFRRDPIASSTSFAYAISALDLIHSYRNQEPSDGSQPISLAMSLLGKKGANIRYALDPKQKEKAFVKECWTAWRNNKSLYDSKAEFARDMLEKCEHLKTTKQIEEWCRQWERKE